jgi:uncharacterized protein (TIGR03083 family)
LDAATTYNETRERIAALVLDTEDQVERPVPACPDWRIKDVVAHLTGLAADWRDDNLEDYASPAWTDAQVEQRRDQDLQRILAEWAEHSSAISPLLNDPARTGLPDFMPLLVITDLAAHEHDVRGALGRPGARDSSAVQVGLRSQIGGLRQHFSALGLEPLRVDAVGMRDWMVGHGDPVATVRGDPFEIFRATGGRRTVEEVRGLDWIGDAEQFIPHFLQPPYEWPQRSLAE